jgi:putative ABC transport system permease protein
LVLGLVASVVALPTAAVIGRWYAQFTADLLNFDTAGFGIPGWVFGVELAAGALLPLAAAAIPVIRGCRIPVSEALRDVGIDGGGTAPSWVQRVSGLARPLLLSLRNAFRRRQRMALTLITLATAGAVYLGALNLRAAIQRSVGAQFDPMRYDIAIRFSSPHAADSIEAVVAGVDGVAKVEGWSARRAALALPDGTVGNTFPISAAPLGSVMSGYSLQTGRLFAAGDSNALVVNRRLVEEEPRLAVGAVVPLVINGRRTDWTVVGVVESGVSPLAHTSREILARMTGTATLDRAVVSAMERAPAAQGELSRRLRDELETRGFAVAGSQLLAESRRSVEDHLLMVAGFLMTMSQLMIVVGGLGLASTMSLAVLERTREIGVLRAIGARRAAILTLVQVEGLVIGIASWLLAIPLSLPMSVLLGQAFGRIMIPVPVTFVPEPSGVGRWLVVVVGVSIIASAWPAFRAMKISTAAALSYTN